MEKPSQNEINMLRQLLTVDALGEGDQQALTKVMAHYLEMTGQPGLEEKKVIDYTHEEIQEITDTDLLKKLIDRSYREEHGIELDIDDAKEEVEKAERQVALQRRRWDRLGYIRFSLENRCKALGADPHEGHYA
jgi:hypothetical protein